MTPPMWMVRASGRAARAGSFREDGTVALGVGREFGAIPDYEAADDLYEALRRAHPSWRPGRHRAAAAQLHCFLREMQPGDHVLTWDAQQQTFYLGTIDSDARWEPDATGEQPFLRAVSWSHGLTPAELSPDCRSALNVIQTLFHVGRGIAQEVLANARPIEQLGGGRGAPAVPVSDDSPTEQRSRIDLGPDGQPKPLPWTAPATDDEIYDVDVQHTPIPGSLKAIRPPAPEATAGVAQPAPAASPDVAAPVVVVEEEDDVSPLSAPPIAAPVLPSPENAVRRARGPDPGGLAAAARQRVEERLGNLGTDALRAVLAGVLQARGYPRRSVDPDSGADLFAGADLLGRDEPPLRVQVLGNGTNPVSADQVQASLEDREPTERWILMAAEGFTRDARTVIDQHTAAGARCTLLDAQDLGRLVLRHYDELDLATRAMVPMVRVWWPAWEEAP